MKGHGSILKNRTTNNERGQSLVEMAIITPILILLFLGVFEVGWALRGYLVLANVNRETARFSVKNGILNFSDPSKDPALVGYDVVLSHTLTSLGYNTGAPLTDPNQRPALPLLFDPGNSNATIIMSHFVIDTGFPCVKPIGGTPNVPYEFDPNCDCTETDPNDSQWFRGDDLIAYPGHPRFPQYGITYGISQTTRLGSPGSGQPGNYQTLAAKLALENNQFNCNVLKNGGSPSDISANNLMIAEAFYDQPQLLGVPLLSNPLTDPIPFYAHTAMRIVSGREAGLSNSVGPVCELLPLAIDESDLVNTGGLAIPPEQNLDIRQSGGNTFNWLYWDSQSGQDSTLYVAEGLDNLRLPLAAFVADDSDPEGTADQFFDLNDWVEIASGVDTDNGGTVDNVDTNSDIVDDLLEEYVHQAVYLPVFDNTGGGAVRIAHIARVTINDVCAPLDGCLSGNRQLSINFETYEDSACE